MAETNPKDGNEKPDLPPESTGPELQRRALLSDTLCAINYGSSVPLSEQQAKLILASQQESPAFSHILDDVKNGEWRKALVTLFTIIFGSKNAVKGLGYVAKSVDNIPLRERAGLVAQLQHQLPNVPLRDKYIGSILRYEVEESLLKEGYTRSPFSPAIGIPVQAPAGGGTVPLRSLLQPTAIERLEHVGADGKQDIVGALPLSTSVPAGSFIYFNAEGLPIFVSMERLDPADIPAAPIYLRGRGREQDEKKTKLERGIEFLEQSIEPGDVVIVSQGGKNETAGHELFEQIQRAKTRDMFHGTHVMVADAGKQFLHVTADAGVSRKSIRTMLYEKPYNAVSVLRLNQSDRIGTFLKNAEERASRTKRFNLAGLVGKAVTPGLKTATEESCICTDFVSESLPELQGLGTPSAIAESPHFRMLYSLELGKE